MQKQAKEAREREEELAHHQNQLFGAFMQRFLVSQGENRPSLVVEYVRQFDHLSRYAPDMVHTEIKKNVSLGTSSGSKEVLRLSPLQVMGSQRSGKKFGFQIRKPNSEGMSSGYSGKSQIEGKRKSGLGNQSRPGQFGENKQARRSFEQWPLCGKCKRRHLGDYSDLPRCYNCEKAGHIALDCWNCYNCGKPGHLTKDCLNSYSYGKPGHFARDCLEQDKLTPT